MKAIETKYLGPTDYKGARIKAFDCDGHSVTISYPHELSGEDCHREAAEALCAKMGWSGPMEGGSTRRGYVFVFVSKDSERQTAALRKAAESVLEWARTPGEHGGNPYCKPMVKLAREALGDDS